MIADKLDDPNDALSFSGVMMMPEQVAEHVERLLDGQSPCSRSLAGAGSSRASSTATRSSHSASPPC